MLLHTYNAQRTRNTAQRVRWTRLPAQSQLHGRTSTSTANPRRARDENKPRDALRMHFHGSPLLVSMPLPMRMRAMS